MTKLDNSGLFSQMEGPQEREEGRKYESPKGCRAVVAVADDGTYIFLEKPDLWVFDVEPAPQDNGFGESFDLLPGVYSMTFDYQEHKDWDTGEVDDWTFTMSSCELLWSAEGKPGILEKLIFPLIDGFLGLIRAKKK